MDKNIKFAIGAAVASVITLANVSAVAANGGPEQKCYGIAAAGKNDCKTANNSCAGQSTKDRQPDAFINLPKGLCSRIADGSLTPHYPAKKTN